MVNYRMKKSQHCLSCTLIVGKLKWRRLEAQSHFKLTLSSNPFFSFYVNFFSCVVELRLHSRKAFAEAVTRRSILGCHSVRQLQPILNNLMEVKLIIV